MRDRLHGKADRGKSRMAPGRAVRRSSGSSPDFPASRGEVSRGHGDSFPIEDQEEPGPQASLIEPDPARIGSLPGRPLPDASLSRVGTSGGRVAEKGSPRNPAEPPFRGARCRSRSRFIVRRSFHPWSEQELSGRARSPLNPKASPHRSSARVSQASSPCAFPAGFLGPRRSCRPEAGGAHRHASGGIHPPGTWRRAAPYRSPATREPACLLTRSGSGEETTTAGMTWA